MMPDGLEIRPFDRTSASDDDCRALWTFAMGAIREVIPDEPEFPFDDWIRIFRTTNSTSETLGWAVWDADGRRVLGSASLSVTSYDSVNASLHISVDSSIRRMGFGSRMLGLAVDTAESRGRTVLKCQSNEGCPAGESFLERTGARVESESHTNRLLLSEVDGLLLKSWLELPRGSCPEFEIRTWRDGIPEDHLEDARNFFQEIYDADPAKDGIPKRDIRYTTDMVRDGNRMFTAGGNRSLALAAVSKESGLLMGYTQVSWHPSKSLTVNQCFTGVRPAFRHAGLARRLKAEMLARIGSEIPAAESIRSGNDDDNEAIMKINREFGFRPFIAKKDWILEILLAQRVPARPG